MTEEKPYQEWKSQVVARQLGGPSGQNLDTWLKGHAYPALLTMRRIEKVFGWSAADQIRLLPFEGKDTVYGEVLRQVIDKWWEATK